MELEYSADLFAASTASLKAEFRNRASGSILRTIINPPAYSGSQAIVWDGRADSQWAQALGPLESAAEHGVRRFILSSTANLFGLPAQPADEAQLHVNLDDAVIRGAIVLRRASSHRSSQSPSVSA